MTGGTAAADDEGGVPAVALYSYTNTADNVIKVNAGDALTAYLSTGNEHWLYVKRHADGKQGYLPPSHVHILSSSSDANAEESDGADAVQVEDPWQDDEFFGSYGTLALHREMLGDVPRTTAYERALCGPPPFRGDLLAGKRVMDVGAGSGILSLFAARAGAAKVYALEPSTLSHYARETVDANGLAHVISVIDRRVEHHDDRFPEKNSVDVIISEWMGTFLIFENVIESVLVARDRYLAPGGKMMPSRSRLFLAPASAHVTYHSKIGFWDDQYGFKMPAMKAEAERIFGAKPLHDHVAKPEDMLAEAQVVLDWDMHTVEIEALKRIEKRFSFTATKDGDMHGLCSWFDVSFDPITEEYKDHVVLSTSPSHPLTHWKHAFLLLDHVVKIVTDDVITGLLVIRQNPLWRRHFLIDLELAIGEKYTCAKTYLMWR